MLLESRSNKLMLLGELELGGLGVADGDVGISRMTKFSRSALRLNSPGM